MEGVSRPRVFLDVNIGSEPAGRLTIELFTDHTPRTAENFRQLCTSENSKKFSFDGCPFHRVVDEFMIQGGDITKGDGTGGTSIYGGEFEDENLDWAEIDKEGLVCMANRGSRDTNTSQFFITLVACPHLNGQNTLFGQLLGARSFETLRKIAKVPVDEENDFRPRTDVVITKCGELVRKNQIPKQTLQPERKETSDSIGTTSTEDSSTSRGRHKRRHSSSPSRSPSPSRGHGRRSASRHRSVSRQNHRHRRRRQEVSASGSSRSRSPTPKPRNRRRSDASPDHTFRGRPRLRSKSRTSTPIPEHDLEVMDIDKKAKGNGLEVQDGDHKHSRKRSPPPSRPRSSSPGYRRQRSLPNVYDEYSKSHDDRRRDRRAGNNMDIDRERKRGGDHDRSDGQRWERHDRRYDHRRSDAHGLLGGGETHGRLGGGADWNDSMTGVKYKGRGIMKFRERETGRKW